MLSFLRLFTMYIRWSLRWPCWSDKSKHPPCSAASTLSRSRGLPCVSDRPSPANTLPGLPSHRATWLHSGPTMGGCLSKPKPGDENSCVENLSLCSAPHWLSYNDCDLCLYLYIGQLKWPLTAVVMWHSFSAGGILMLLIALCSRGLDSAIWVGFRMFHNVLLFLFYGGWGRGYYSVAPKRLSSDQRLSCESVTMGVGF